MFPETVRDRKSRRTKKKFLPISSTAAEFPGAGEAPGTLPAAVTPAAEPPPIAGAAGIPAAGPPPMEGAAVTPAAGPPPIAGAAVIPAAGPPMEGAAEIPPADPPPTTGAAASVTTMQASDAAAAVLRAEDLSTAGNPTRMITKISFVLNIRKMRNTKLFLMRQMSLMITTRKRTSAERREDSAFADVRWRSGRENSSFAAIILRWESAQRFCCF